MGLTAQFLASEPPRLFLRILHGSGAIFWGNRDKKCIRPSGPLWRVTDELNEKIQYRTLECHDYARFPRKNRNERGKKICSGHQQGLTVPSHYQQDESQTSSSAVAGRHYSADNPTLTSYNVNFYFFWHRAWRFPHHHLEIEVRR
jgi:hypothetical protein